MATKFATKSYPPLSLQDIDNARQPSCGFYIITPLLASVILKDRNPENRTIREAKVAQIVSDMNDGKFPLNGESIIFSQAGTLLDGQHRLQASSLTGVAFQSVVVLGMPADVKDTHDQGRARTVGDVLQIDGICNGTTVAAMARNLAGYDLSDGARIGGAARLSRAKVMESARVYKSLESIGRWAHHLAPTLRGISSPSILGTCRAILEPRFGPEAVYYLERVAIGDNVAVGDPAFAVRQRLTGLRATPTQIEVILRGAIAHMEGRKLSRTQIEGTLPRLPAVNPLYTGE